MRRRAFITLLGGAAVHARGSFSGKAMELGSWFYHMAKLSLMVELAAPHVLHRRAVSCARNLSW